MLPRAEAMLGPLFSAFADLGVSAVPVVYSDDAVDEVRSELVALDGVVVWVNPIQDGATRVRLDQLLREVAGDGVWVSAHPDVIDKMGTKEVLYATRDLGWGTDTACYRSADELAQHFPERLGRYGRIVVKQARGTGGTGVWRVELPDPSREAPVLDDTVLVQRSLPREITPSVDTTLAAFVEECRKCLAWSGCLVDQPYQDRLAEGMIRVYFVHNKVAGFCHQWPKGLLEPGTPDDPARPAPTMEDPDTPAYAELRVKAETDWVPEMQRILGLSNDELPVIWDADFLFGAKANKGDEKYVLCEINVQAVWPYPTQSSRRLAKAAVERAQANKLARPSQCKHGITTLRRVFE
jgi:hypothetical protein